MTRIQRRAKLNYIAAGQLRDYAAQHAKDDPKREKWLPLAQKLEAATDKMLAA